MALAEATKGAQTMAAKTTRKSDTFNKKTAARGKLGTSGRTSTLTTITFAKSSITFGR
jgi:hypothetical protein